MQEEKFEKIAQFYALTHKLKNLLRSGWVQWDIKSERIESVAEHIYGTQMLAFAINSEFALGLDLEKVCLMLAFHELGETIVGDITILDEISKEEKCKKETEAVYQILKDLRDKEIIEKVFLEFEEQKTEEARFAKMIDKFECDLQCKYYEENLCNDISYPRTGIDEQIRQQGMKAGDTTLAQIWLNYDKENCNYNQLFKDFVDYVLKNDIFAKD